jgi:hypothetical protein
MKRRTVNLRPLHPRDRWVYLVCITLSITLVLTGWILSLRSALAPDVEAIRTDLDETFEKAGDRLNTIESGTSAYTHTFRESWQQAVESYEETKATQ